MGLEAHGTKNLSDMSMKGRRMESGMATVESRESGLLYQFQG